MYVLIGISLYVSILTLAQCLCLRFPRRGQNDQYGDEDLSSSDEAPEQADTDTVSDTQTVIDETVPDRCCLCDRVLNGPGYNAYPILDFADTESRCCNRCKHDHVIPARQASRRKEEMHTRRQDILVRDQLNKILDTVFMEEKRA